MKRFEEYNKKYKHLETTFTDEEKAINYHSFVYREAVYVKKWDNTIRTWTQDQIQYAVYDSATAEEWQKFRVSLKGFSTQEKLLRLKWRAKRSYKFDREEFELEWCRIDNYIGALVRGGQLNQNLEIMK